MGLNSAVYMMMRGNCFGRIEKYYTRIDARKKYLQETLLQGLYYAYVSLCEWVSEWPVDVCIP